MGDGIPKITAAILDYGQVLSRWPGPQEFGLMAEVLDLETEAFRQLWRATRGPYDRGDVTAQEYWLKLAIETKRSLSGQQIDRLRKLEVEMWCRPDPDMLAWLQRLQAAGVKTALLSNMTQDLMSYMRQNCRWIDKFNFLTFSVEVRLIKPDPAIYQHTLRGLGATASETIFVDDHEVNVRAASALGIHAIQFQSIGQLSQELEKIGFPILPVSANQSK